MSGYTPCACRDCPDDTISSDVTKPDLCWHCEESGCTPYDDVYDGFDCQREDAYDMAGFDQD